MPNLNLYDLVTDGQRTGVLMEKRAALALVSWSPPPFGRRNAEIVCLDELRAVTLPDTSGTSVFRAAA